MNSPDATQTGLLLRRCYGALLDALGESERRGERASSADSSAMTIAHLLNRMAAQGFAGQQTETDVDEIDPRMAPCLFVDQAGLPLVVLSVATDGLLVFDPATEAHRLQPRDATTGTLFVFRRMLPEDASLIDPHPDWLGALARRFRGAIVIGMILSLILAIAGIVGPMLVMTIYERMSIPSASRGIGWLWGGVIVYLVAVMGFRTIRSRLLLFVGNRVGFLTGTEVMRRVLRLPAHQTENVPIGSQIARIRDFESLREFFSGPAAIALMEMPFILVLLGALFFLAGDVAWISVGAILVFMVLAFALEPLLRRVTARGAMSSKRKNDLIFMAFGNIGAIQRSGTEQVWREKYRTLSGESAIDSIQSASISGAFSALSQGLVSAAGGGTMLLGVFRVMEGRLAVPELIAAMLLCWRVLAPLRTGFGIAIQLDRIRRSAIQINRLMALPMESARQAATVASSPVDGTVRFLGVSHRYAPDAQPALLNVEFEVRHGEVVAIFGHAGSGRSTVLKAIMGVIVPQAGRVLHGNHNIRQVDPRQLRQSLGYAPDENSFLRGTISENLSAVSPLVSAARQQALLEQWGLWERVSELPGALSHPIDDATRAAMPPSFFKRLNLARAFMKDTPLLLLDDPTRYLDSDDVVLFQNQVRRLGRASTVLIASQDMRVLSIADRVVWLDNGVMRFFGTADAFRAAYRPDASASEGGPR